MTPPLVLRIISLVGYVFFQQCKHALSLGIATRVYQSSACFGVAGINITSNELACYSSRLNRICIEDVYYGQKRPSPGRNCPENGVSSWAPSACCTKTGIDGTDCIIPGNSERKKKVQMDCAKQAINRCNIQVDQINSYFFTQCNERTKVSSFRMVYYRCIMDDDDDAKERGCFVSVTTHKPPPVVGVTDNHVVNKHTTRKSAIPKPDLGVTIRTPAGPIDMSRLVRSSRNLYKSSSPSSVEHAKTSGLSKDESVILGVCVGVVGFILLVILAFGIRTLLRRHQMKIKNQRLMSNLNKDKLNNESDALSSEGQAGDQSNISRQSPSDTVYEVINELEMPKTTPEVNVNQNSSTNGDLHSGTAQLTQKLAPIAEHSSQEKLSNDNLIKQTDPMYNNQNSKYDTTTRKIIDKVLNTENGNIFKNKRNIKEGREKQGYDSDTATFRRVAQFVKKCIKDIDITDTHKKKGLSKKGRSRVNGNGSKRHKRSKSRRRTRTSDAADKGLDTPKIMSRSQSKSVTKKRKSSKDKNGQRHRQSYEYRNEESQHSDVSIEPSDETPCRFPVREHSIMRKKKRQRVETDSISSLSEIEQEQPRSTAVRFQKKLTYIGDKKKSNRSKHKIKLQRTNAENQDSYSDYRRQSKSERRNNSTESEDSEFTPNNFRQVQPRRDSLEISECRKGRSRLHANENAGSILKPHSRRSSNHKNKRSKHKLHKSDSRSSAQRHYSHRLKSEKRLRSSRHKKESRKTSGTKRTNKSESEYSTESNDEDMGSSRA